MPSIVDQLEFEEGWNSKPYLDSLGYPTIGTGFKIGPQGAPLSHYQFQISKAIGAVWLTELIQAKTSEMNENSAIAAAMAVCNDARQGVLISMAYQMGTSGLAAFANTLQCIANQDWQGAHDGMLNSTWAKQTPARANRQANQMLTGTWDPAYGV